MSYAPSDTDLFAGATYVDKVLKGTDPRQSTG